MVKSLALVDRVMTSRLEGRIFESRILILSVFWPLKILIRLLFGTRNFDSFDYVDTSIPSFFFIYF